MLLTYLKRSKYESQDLREERKIFTLKGVKKFLSLLPTNDSGLNPAAINVKANCLNENGPPSSTRPRVSTSGVT